MAQSSEPEKLCLFCSGNASIAELRKWIAEECTEIGKTLKTTRVAEEGLRIEAQELAAIKMEAARSEEDTRRIEEQIKALTMFKEGPTAYLQELKEKEYAEMLELCKVCWEPSKKPSALKNSKRHTARLHRDYEYLNKLLNHLNEQESAIYLMKSKTQAKLDKLKMNQALKNIKPLKLSKSSSDEDWTQTFATPPQIDMTEAPKDVNSSAIPTPRRVHIKIAPSRPPKPDHTHRRTMHPNSSSTSLPPPRPPPLPPIEEIIFPAHLFDENASYVLDLD